MVDILHSGEHDRESGCIHNSLTQARYCRGVVVMGLMTLRDDMHVFVCLHIEKLTRFQDT
jgi:hypothetical protein